MPIIHIYKSNDSAKYQCKWLLFNILLIHFIYHKYSIYKLKFITFIFETMLSMKRAELKSL